MRKTVLHESRAQRWRALAVLDDGAEALLYLGSSIVQVRENYHVPWFELFEKEIRDKVDSIELQKWAGAPDCGEWITQSNLPLPGSRTKVA